MDEETSRKTRVSFDDMKCEYIVRPARFRLMNRLWMKINSEEKEEKERERPVANALNNTTYVTRTYLN